MGVKALSAVEPPQWFELEAAEGLRIQVKALSDAERESMLAAIDRAPVLGYALAKQRRDVGADEPTEQARNAAQSAWAAALPPKHRAALAAAETFPLRTLQAWVNACVVAVEVEGVPVRDSLADLLGGIPDPTLYVDALTEAAGLCAEFSTLGKAGPMCSGRLCGQPGARPAGGTATTAPQDAADFAASAAGGFPMMPDLSHVEATASPSAMSAGG